MYMNNKLWIAQSDKNICILPNMANRHGLIAGASGTGKTVSLKVLAESFSDAGVPVFLADIKGDLSGMITEGSETDIIRKRVEEFPIENWTYKKFPTAFWDIYAEMGIPIRITVSEAGPLLLSRLLGLSEIQEEVLNVIFKIADDNSLLLTDIKDLKAMVEYCSEKKAEFSPKYGNMSPQSLGSIQRALVSLEAQGGENFFGEPSVDFNDWLRKTEDGRGYINVLYAVKLIHNPLLYTTFMLWLMSTMFEDLPEVGDLEKPKMVFFFDEAHLLFSDISKSLKSKIVQVVKLIRSKGIGIYFISQSPSDIPDEILAQLGNRIQHSLRAYTPAEQKAVKAAASAFRVNPDFDTEDAITNLATGEALVSFLDADGSPSVVEKACILPPQSLIGSAEEVMVHATVLSDPFNKKYMDAIDDISAYEILTERKEADMQALEAEKKALEKAKEEALLAKEKEKEEAKLAKEKEKQEKEQKKKEEQKKKTIFGFFKSSARTASNMVTREVVRNILKCFKK